MVYEGSDFSVSLPTLVVIWFFDPSHSSECEVLSHCVQQAFLIHAEQLLRTRGLLSGSLEALCLDTSFSPPLPFLSPTFL